MVGLVPYVEQAAQQLALREALLEVNRVFFGCFRCLLFDFRVKGWWRCVMRHQRMRTVSLLDLPCASGE